MDGIFKELSGSESDEELVTKTARNVEARARLLPKGQDATDIFSKIEANRELFSKQEMNAFHSWRDIRNKYLHAHILNVSDRNSFANDYKIFYSALERVTRKAAGVSFNNLSLSELFQILVIATIQDLFSFDLGLTISALFRIGVAFLIFWLIATFAFPFLQMTIAILLIPIAFYFKRFKIWILLSSIIVCIYSCFTWKTDWYNFEMLEYFPSISNYFFGFFIANIIAGLISATLLLRPYFVKNNSV